MRRLCASAILAVLLAGSARSGVEPVGENIILDSLGEDWKVGFQRTRSNVSITEFVRGKETVHDWSQLVTLTVVDGTRDADLDKYTRNLRASLRQRCAVGGRVRTVGSERVSGLPARVLVVECSAYPGGKPESHVQLNVAGREALYIFQRAAKVGRLDEKTVRAWGRFLRKLRVCDTRDPARPCAAGAGQAIDARSEMERKARGSPPRGR